MYVEDTVDSSYYAEYLHLGKVGNGEESVTEVGYHEDAVTRGDVNIYANYENYVALGVTVDEWGEEGDGYDDPRDLAAPSWSTIAERGELFSGGKEDWRSALEESEEESGKKQ